MSNIKDFVGFNKETIRFFSQLKKNNNRVWFEKHKSEYETDVLEPAKFFVEAMGQRLKSISPDVLVVPQINKSLFRINRDTRFSPDKSPYKTHLGIFFWEGSRPRMECSGFYFHLEPPDLMLGVGIYRFPKTDVLRFRKAVVDPDTGEKLSRIFKKISEMEGYEPGGKHYKRVPAGFDPAHPSAELLLYNGLYVGHTIAVPDELFSADLVDFCWNKYKPLIPLHKWLVDVRIGFY
ncbi:MAG: DUF2461 domain-containing protein [Candidatus Aminicenantes bacterium]|jgi:uncharacterized protein (TIGR02453 family)